MFIRFIAVHTTTYCTLRCKKCLWRFDEFTPKQHSDCDTIIRAMDKTFEIVSYADELRLAGAESFLHPDIERILLSAGKYKSQFNFLSIATNGTYIPRLSAIETIANLPYDVLFRIDDYGPLSKKLNELIDVLAKYGIKPEVRQYYGDDQAFGGWIDIGDYEYKNYSEAELKSLFYSCKMIREEQPDSSDCLIIWEGKLYICPYIASGIKLGKFPESKRDFVDLFDETTTIAQKREAVLAWKDEPFLGCSYCNGYDPENSPRIPAAEQM